MAKGYYTVGKEWNTTHGKLAYKIWKLGTSYLQQSSCSSALNSVTFHNCRINTYKYYTLICYNYVGIWLYRLFIREYIVSIYDWCCWTATILLLLAKSLRAMHRWDCLDWGFCPLYKYTKLSLSYIDNTILERTKTVTTWYGTPHSSKYGRLLTGVWHSSSLD